MAHFLALSGCILSAFIPSLRSATMFPNTLFLLLAVAAFVQAAFIPEPREVYTATRVYKTLTDVPPFIIEATTTFTWTAGPETTVAHPTGPGLPGGHDHGAP
ncbi:hypothetical protein R3P38DRAFT_3247059 [Favolaschia claudopus]|uniref:Uncharacterized protein n=1 Tax=Favolaschia claudopus TaxID=2862362 RepID=A0AAV9YY94_9AGAR